MIWSWNEKDMAFGRQLHQAERKFRTMEIKVRNPQSTVRKFRTPQTKVRNWNLACENGIFLPTLFLQIFLCLNFHFLLVFSHSCNSLARKYPGKGKITFLYKFSCNHWKIIFRGAFFRRPTYVTLLYRDLFCFLFLSSIFYFLASQTPSEDVFPEDERLNQKFLGVKEARWKVQIKRWKISVH